MSRIYDVCEALANAIEAAMTAASVIGAEFKVEPLDVTGTIDPGQIIVGAPLVPEFVQIMAQPAGQWQISVFPIGKAKSTARYSPFDQPISGQSSTTLVATVNDGLITFSGSVGAAPVNIHTVINGDGDGYYQAQPGAELPAIATAVAAAVNALDLEGVTATPSGPTVSITGTADGSLFCNVVGTNGTVSYEVNRLERTLDVSVWANFPEVRGIIVESIEARVGNTLQSFLTLPDGTLMYVSLDGDGVDDDLQSGYSVYRTHLFVTVEYGIMLTNEVSQLGAIVNDIKINNKPAVLYVGGVPAGG